MAYKPMEQRFTSEQENCHDPRLDVRLEAMFRAYREACPDPEPSVNFMPAVWAKIEARQTTTTVFSRMARALVGVAVAVTIVFGMMLSTSTNQSSFDGSYIEAMTADHLSQLDAMNLDRISEMEQH